MNSNLLTIASFVVAGKLLIRLVRSNKKVADIFTKGLPEPAFHHFRGKQLSPTCLVIGQSAVHPCHAINHSISLSLSLWLFSQKTF